MNYSVVPLRLRAANAFVAEHHRHHKPVRGHRFSLGAWLDISETLLGVCIVGRPVARGFDPEKVVEVNRLCTLGHKNACSFLYGAAARVAREMGFERIITYTLPAEGGGSLRAAGWQCVAETAGGSWDCPSRPRIDQAPIDPKWRWERVLK